MLPTRLVFANLFYLLNKPLPHNAFITSDQCRCICNDHYHQTNNKNVHSSFTTHRFFYCLILSVQDNQCIHS
uniref:Secreted protein n=1 Tax=Ditylenchus dipsaci TaxID=166011 RepID=A0A915CR42_9BILA